MHVSNYLGGVYPERFAGGDVAVLKQMVDADFKGRMEGRDGGILNHAFFLLKCHISRNFGPRLWEVIALDTVD